MPATSAMQGAYLPQYPHMQTTAVPVEVSTDHPVAMVVSKVGKLNRTQNRSYQMSHVCISNWI